jgi:hypothetical protein
MRIFIMEFATVMRGVGVFALLLFGTTAAVWGLGERQFIILVIAIIAVSAPESLDKLPFGPNKD